MGIKKFIKHTIFPITRSVDTVKNILDEESIIDGYKKTIKQEITEDNPLTSIIYNSGKYDGKKEGYAEASDEYEHKLLEQADMFLEQKNVFEYERDKYEELLDEYDKEIQYLEKKVNKTEFEKNILQELLSKERKLKTLE